MILFIPDGRMDCQQTKADDLERKAGIEPASLDWQTSALPLSYKRSLVEIARFELASPECKSGVLATALNPQAVGNKKASQFPERLASG
jgi:hypothetical protein